jgi:hypothetical protein
MPLHLQAVNPLKKLLQSVNYEDCKYLFNLRWKIPQRKQTNFSEHESDH